MNIIKSQYLYLMIVYRCPSIKPINLLPTGMKIPKVGCVSSLKVFCEKNDYEYNSKKLKNIYVNQKSFSVFPLFVRNLSFGQTCILFFHR